MYWALLLKQSSTNYLRNPQHKTLHRVAKSHTFGARHAIGLCLAFSQKSCLIMRLQLQWNAAKNCIGKLIGSKTEHWLFLSGAFLRLNTTAQMSYCFCGKTTFCNIAAVEHKEILEHLHCYVVLFIICILINYFSIHC